MGIISETRFIERLQFFNGERLFASDLQGLEAFNREMRWLHNHSLHQPGIGKGFAVCGKKGDREVKIKPGYAIDSFGREIVLSESWVEAVPPVAGEEDGTSVFYDLTVSYPADWDLEEAETREGICLPRGVVRLREKPVFCWVRLQRDDKGGLSPKNPKLQFDIRDGLKIVLARAEVLNCKLNKDISIAERRSARPARQPYVVAGTVEPTDWKALVIAENQIDKAAQEATATRAISPLFVFPTGLTAHIDTSHAGFLTVPFYCAQILGPRTKEIGGTNEFKVIVDGLISICDPKSTGFRVDVLLVMQPMSAGGKPESSAAFLGAEPTDSNFAKIFSDWNIAWMGVES